MPVITAQLVPSLENLDTVPSWIRWARSRQGQRTRNRWARSHAALAGWSVDDLGAPRSSLRTDAMQAALVGLAQRGDGPALTTLVTQLRPGLINIVRWARSRRRVGSPADAESEVLAVFCETVLRHRLDRRPAKIAANLLLDTRQQIWRAASREDRALTAAGRQRPWPEADPADPETAVAGLDLVARVVAAIDGLSGTVESRRLSAEVAYRAWFLDQTSPTIGRHVGLEAEAVRTRLTRVRRALRQAIDLPAAA